MTEQDALAAIRAIPVGQCDVLNNRVILNDCNGWIYVEGTNNRKFSPSEAAAWLAKHPKRQRAKRKRL